MPGGTGEVVTIYSGAGPLTDPEEEHLSEIIARINEPFGTDWTEEDQLVFEAAAQTSSRTRRSGTRPSTTTRPRSATTSSRANSRRR